MKSVYLLSALALATSFASQADEGQWQPHQLAELQNWWQALMRLADRQIS